MVSGRNSHNGGYREIFVLKNSSQNPQKILRYRSWSTDSKNITFLRCWGKILEIFNLKCNYKKEIQNCHISGNIEVIEKMKPKKNEGRNEQENVFSWASKMVQKFRNFHNCGYWKILLLKKSSKNPQKNLKYRFERPDSKTVASLWCWGNILEKKTLITIGDYGNGTG